MAAPHPRQFALQIRHPGMFHANLATLKIHVEAMQTVSAGGARAAFHQSNVTEVKARVPQQLPSACPMDLATVVNRVQLTHNATLNFLAIPNEIYVRKGNVSIVTENGRRIPGVIPIQPPPFVMERHAEAAQLMKSAVISIWMVVVASAVTLVNKPVAVSVVYPTQAKDAVSSAARLTSSVKAVTRTQVLIAKNSSLMPPFA